MLQLICLLKKSFNISRKFSRPAMGSVGSAEILSSFSLHLFSKSIVAPKVESQAIVRDLNCCACCYKGKFPFSLLMQPHMFHFGFGSTSDCKCLFSTQTRGGTGSFLLGLSCSVGLGRERSTAGTAGVGRECLPWLRSVGDLHSLRQVVSFPRVVGPGMWDPCQKKAASHEDVGSDPRLVRYWPRQ